jgi:hypothetical protein
MILWFLKPKNEFAALAFHVFFAFLTLTSPYFFGLWMWIFMGTSFLGLLLNRNKDNIMTYTLGYLLGIEVLSRMSRGYATGMVPDEIGKYFPLYVLVAAFLVEGKLRSNALAIAIIVLTLPSLALIDPEITPVRYGIVFNYLGIFNLALMILYFSKKQLDYLQLKTLFKSILLPLISTLVFITIRSPDFKDTNFDLGANFDMAGGFASNQVSTVLGLGFFLLGIIYLFNDRIFKYKFLDMALMGYFVFRGLLTFSRGGVMVPIFALIVLYFILSRANAKQIMEMGLRKINLKVIFPVLIGAFVVWTITDSITGGQLTLRYQGETAGTVAGVREKDINHYTSHRVAIATGDLLLFKEHPLFGVGPGMSKSLRNEEFTNMGSHVEFSRLAAEHGLGGVLVCLLLLFAPLNRFLKMRNPMIKGLFAAFILLSILTSFHAAMRTATTPLFFGLAYATFNFSGMHAMKRKSPERQPTAARGPIELSNA